MPLIDLRNALITMRDGSTNFIEIKVGQGNLTYTEKRQIDLIKSRGKLDTVRENEDEGMEVSFSFMWEFLKSAQAEPPTVEDALKQIGPAASWVSASSDPLSPYCVHLEIQHTPICPGVYKETILLPMFHRSQLAHSLLDATIACNGICNAKEATIVRNSQA